MKGWLSCNNHNGSITTQKRPSLLWRKQGKKGRGKEHDTRKGKQKLMWEILRNITKIWETRTKEKKTIYRFIKTVNLPQNSIKNNTSAIPLNILSTALLHYHLKSPREKKHTRNHPSLKRQLMLKTNSKTQTFREHYECWMFS